MGNKTKLAAKLVKILDNMASVPKKGYNESQRYHYMREVDVLEALKKELVENKVIMLTSSNHVQTEKKDRIDKRTGNTVTEFLVTVHTTHTFIDSESGEELSITSVGSGIDSGDKSASKAITAATKYALLKTFMISDEGADIENDGSSVVAPQSNAPAKSMLSKIAAAKKEEPKQEEPVTPTLEKKEFKPKLSKFEPPTKQETPKTETKSEPVKASNGNGSASLLSKIAAAKSSPAFQSLGKPGLIDDPEFK